MPSHVLYEESGEAGQVGALLRAFSSLLASQSYRCFSDYVPVALLFSSLYHVGPCSDGEKTALIK